MSLGNDLELTQDEIVALIDKEATRRYDCSAADFVAQYRNGTLGECDIADLVSLARLLPKDHPLSLAVVTV